MTTTKEAVLSTIEYAITQQPRTLQTAIGPSELAMECEHCLAAKLAGWEQLPEAAWLPFIGTAVHAMLETMFEPLPEYLTEQRVNVGVIRGRSVDGTSDLFHIPNGCVVDHKIGGKSTLDKARRKPTSQYIGQAHAYGVGFVRAGFDVKTVAINFLPRNDISLRRGVWWEEPFDPLLALGVFDDVARLEDTLDAFSSTEERDAYITSLPRDPKCFNCGRYADRPVAEPKAAPKTLAAALGV